MKKPEITLSELHLEQFQEISTSTNIFNNSL